MLSKCMGHAVVAAAPSVKWDVTDHRPLCRDGVHHWRRQLRSGKPRAPWFKGNGEVRALALAALGVVYGDIGTSPLYTMREAFGHAGGCT
jgi:K+ potassium transporter